MKSINVVELSRKMESENIKLIDVRTRAEFSSASIENSINIPMQEIMGQVQELRSDGPVYISCNSGSRSFMVCQALSQQGFNNLVNVEGGIQAWMRQGYPVK